MSQIHVNQIKAYLEATFESFINLDDVKNAGIEQRRTTLLTRALAAFVPHVLGGLDPEMAAQCVVDGHGDNGLDAIFYDRTEKSLYLVQSKWKSDGHGSIELGEQSSFINGFKDLLNADFDRFNLKAVGKRAEIESAINDASTKFILVVIASGQEEFSEHVAARFTDLLTEMNDPVDVLSVRHLKQADIHKIIAKGAQGTPINVDAVLFEWGQLVEPFLSYYGQISAGDLADWYAKYYPRILSPNLRVFLGSTDVNTDIVETLRDDPERFWYYNNGITALCQSIRKKPIGGAGRGTGIFECEGLVIVNGAQTLGSIATAWAKNPEAAERARVAIRFISLEKCQEDIAISITRATNTQNRIEKRDFVALDENQSRIQIELKFDKIIYSYKSGDSLSQIEHGFDLAEATVAQACSSQDISMAIQAKREISKLWEDISKVPYRALFNPGVSGRTLWRKVQVLRGIEGELKVVHSDRVGRASMIPIHGNRMIAYEVFQRLDVEELVGANDIAPIVQQARQMVPMVCDFIGEAALELYPEAYMASLFKNVAKCRAIHNHITDLGHL